MNKLLKQAFTLIELLVVIAIIGILSGLIVVVMGGMTTKATIAKAQVFSNSLKNSLMSNLISEWRFDQINSPSTDQTPDNWGTNIGTLKENNYVGTCDATHCPQLVSTNCIHDNCLYFDGINDYIDAGNGSNLVITNAITVAFWIKTISISKYILADDWGYSYMESDGKIRWRPMAGGALVVSTSTINDNAWHFFTGTYNKDGGTNNVKMYIDGILNNYSTITGSLATGALALTIGGFPGGSGSAYCNAFLDDVRIYNDTVSTSQIKKQYYAELNNLLTKEKIKEKEYRNRINQLAINE